MIIYVKDENHRVYHDKNGVKHSSPIYREYWQPQEVVNETPRSWILRNGIKVPKNTTFPTHRFALNEQQVDDDVWSQAYGYKVAEKVRWKATPSQLRQIAQIIGYEPEV